MYNSNFCFPLTADFRTLPLGLGTGRLDLVSITSELGPTGRFWCLVLWACRASWYATSNAWPSVSMISYVRFCTFRREEKRGRQNFTGYSSSFQFAVRQKNTSEQSFFPRSWKQNCITRSGTNLLSILKQQAAPLGTLGVFIRCSLVLKLLLAALYCSAPDGFQNMTKYLRLKTEDPSFSLHVLCSLKAICVQQRGSSEITYISVAWDKHFCVLNVWL